MFKYFISRFLSSKFVPNMKKNKNILNIIPKYPEPLPFLVKVEVLFTIVSVEIFDPVVKDQL